MTMLMLLIIPYIIVTLSIKISFLKEMVFYEYYILIVVDWMQNLTS